jgi:carboxypeptidase Q
MLHRTLLPLLLVSGLMPTAQAARRGTPPPEPDIVAAELLGRALQSDEAYEELEQLCDTIGHRLSGSPQLDLATAWAAAKLAEDGLVVTKEPVMVPSWTRGPASLSMVHPLNANLRLLALGGSISTPADGIEADVLVVSTFQELTERGAEAKGKIVVFNAPFTTYGETVGYRYAGAREASRVGAVASLVRSISPSSLDTPHTGTQAYADDIAPIPTAAITLEDAERLHRLQRRGVTPRLRLNLSASQGEDVLSHNVVGELKGRELPEEIVVLGCHLDSWDVGQGAQDDGAGCVTVMEAVAQLAALPVAPRRTVRVVLYTNEENGLAGGRAYAEAHADEHIVAAVEDDTGSGQPLGFRAEIRKAKAAPDEGMERDEAATEAFIASLTPYLPWFAPTGAVDLSVGGSGADVGPLVAQGAVGFGLSHDMSNYWPIHHTDADTFDKVDPVLVKRNVATMTVFAWILAEVAPLSGAAK